MSSRYRKRRRLTLPDADAAEWSTASPEQPTQQPHTPEDGQDSENHDEMDVEIWHAFREENYEVLEQLPLTLHRMYSLMRELDEKAQDYLSRLQAKMRTYIRKRRSLALAMSPEIKASPISNDPSISQRTDGQPSQDVEVNTEANNRSEVTRVISPPPPPPPLLHKPETSQTQEAPFSAALENDPHEEKEVTKETSPLQGTELTQPDANEDITQSLLQLIGLLSGDAARTADEKYHLASSAYDLVDRHVRLLDQSIQEQELALQLGLREGTHPAPIAALETEVGRGRGRPRRGELNIPEQPRRTIVLPPRRNGRRRPAPSGKGVQISDNAFTGDDLEMGKDEVNPHEPRYCLCNGVSWGQMVACDMGDDCPKEWFHLSCVGLDKFPAEGVKWYCPDCRASMHPLKTNLKKRNRKR